MKQEYYTEQKVAAMCGIPYTTLRQWRYKVRRKNYWKTKDAAPWYYYGPRLIEGVDYNKGSHRQKHYTSEGIAKVRQLAQRYKQRKEVQPCSN